MQLPRSRRAGRAFDRRVGEHARAVGRVHAPPPPNGLNAQISRGRTSPPDIEADDPRGNDAQLRGATPALGTAYPAIELTLPGRRARGNRR